MMHMCSAKLEYECAEAVPDVTLIHNHWEAKLICRSTTEKCTNVRHQTEHHCGDKFCDPTPEKITV